MKKLWNTSLVPIQWAKPHDATKMPQLLCVKLEDSKKNYIPGPEAITCCHTPGTGCEARVVYETRWVEAGTLTKNGATPHTVIFSLAPSKRQIQPCSAPSNLRDLQVLKSLAEENIKYLQHWFSLNSLKMNADKTWD